MESYDIRKKIIKDKFDKLDLKTIFNGHMIGLMSDNTYGVIFDDSNDLKSSTSINANYFMFNYIGINDYESIVYYANYIIDMFEEKYQIMYKGGNPKLFNDTDFDESQIKNLYQYFMNEYERENMGLNN